MLLTTHQVTSSHSVIHLVILSSRFPHVQGTGVADPLGEHHTWEPFGLWCNSNNKAL